MDLLPKQTIAIDYLEDCETTELLYGGAAGGGKSQLGAYFQLKNRMRYPGTRGLIGRAALKTLKETSLQTFFEVSKRQGVLRGKHFDLTSSNDKEFPNSLVFANGSMIYLKDLFQYPSDPDFDEFGSLEITDAWIDEAAQISQKAKDVVTSRMRYKLTEYGLIPKLLVTTNPFKGWGYNDFYRPNKEPGGLPAYRKFVAALPKDNPYLPQPYLDQLLRLPTAQRQRLYYGNWEYDDDPAALIEYDKILDMWTNRHVEDGQKFITCDVARYGRDTTKIAVWSGWRIVRWISMAKSGIDQVVGKLLELMDIHGVPKSNVIVDEDGVGGGVVDFIKCKGFVNNSRPMEEMTASGPQVPNYVNLKSQCYFRLAQRINSGGVFIATELPVEERQQLIEDLEQVKQKDMDKDGKRAVIPKDLVKELTGRSPDGSDNMAMREYFELKPKKALAIA